MVYIGELWIECPLEPVLTFLVQAGLSCQWVSDSRRLLLEHFDTIHNSPSQIYHSALPFCPSSSWLHKYYTAELSGEVKVVKGFPTGWGECSRTVKFNGHPLALACWKDTVAVGLSSHSIIILNAVTGSQLAVFSGHTKGVGSLAFIPDGTSLVSGSIDKTVKLWDVQTGGVVKTFHGHTNSVLSVSISPDCTIIASGSSDNTVCLWDTQTGKCQHVIKQQGQVIHVVFSPTNPQHLMSVSGGFICMWDINGHQVGHIHEGTHAAFSPDGTHFISCQEDVSTIRNSESRVAVAKCKLPEYNHNSGFDPHLIDSCFSADGRLVAVATSTTTFVWDVTNSDPLPLKTFLRNIASITSITFSSPSTLISASWSESVRFWEIGGLLTNPVAGDPKSTPPTSVRIVSVHLQTESGIAISSDWNGVVRTWDLLTGHCNASFQTPSGANYPRDARVIDGRLISVWGGQKKIHIWDTDKGELLQTADIYGHKPGNLRISGDGSKVFCHTEGFIQAWSIQTGEAMGKVEVEDGLIPGSLHVDCSKIWVSFYDKPTQGWDFGVSGSSPVSLSNISSERLRLVFGTSKPLRIENVVTKKVVFQLPGRYANSWYGEWDGQYLVAGYSSGEVLILDFCDVHHL